ncbi:hypothetical protein C0993_002449, partial [Termitomyces sp. T159_Od127]
FGPGDEEDDWDYDRLLSFPEESIPTTPPYDTSTVPMIFTPPSVPEQLLDSERLDVPHIHSLRRAAVCSSKPTSTEPMLQLSPVHSASTSPELPIPTSKLFKSRKIDALHQEILDLLHLHYGFTPPLPLPRSTPLLTSEAGSKRLFGVKDYDAYVRQREMILTQPRGRVALMRGGIIWRLSTFVVNFPSILQGPTGWSPIPNTMVTVRDPKTNELFIDDSLTDVELSLISGKRAEVSAKLEDQAAFSAELEIKLKETASALQETRSVLDTMGCKKKMSWLNQEPNFDSGEDMELEENKSKLDATELKQVELSMELDAQVALSARIRHQFERAEAVASQASETKDITIDDLTTELSQVERDLSNIRLEKEELLSKDNILNQLRNELSTLETNSSNALTISAALQERVNEVRKLNQVRQDKASLEDILSAARVSTTQYKAKVAMDAELIKARTRLQVVTAEKITLTAKLLEATSAHPVPVSESVPVLLQGQQEARSHEAGDRDDVDVGTPDEGARYQEGPDKMNVDETNLLTDRGVTPSAAPSSSLDSHIVDATVVSTPPEGLDHSFREKAWISVAQRKGRHVITIPPHAHTNPSARSPDTIIALDLRRSKRTMTSVEGLFAASHVEHSQPSFRPSTASAGLSGLRPRSPSTLGRGGSLMHGGVRSVRSVLRDPRSTHSNEGSGRVPGHVAP